MAGQNRNHFTSASIIIMTFARFLWTRFDLARIRAWDNHEKTRNAFVMGLSGVHGTITLAMAFSLP
ncbi:hypothetical protein WP50_03580, partial [Lactiplantibacillus plantarum]